MYGPTITAAGIFITLRNLDPPDVRDILLALNDTLYSLSFFIIAVLLAIRRVRKVKRVFVPDFMRGLSFVNGAYVGEADPGAYGLVGTKKHIELVDMRPQPVLLDRTVFQDLWKNTAFISISADLLVLDPYRASTTLKNQIKDCLPIARNAVRATLAKSTAREDGEYRVRVVTDIAEAVNAELDSVGMKVQNVQIIEFWLRPIMDVVTGVAQ